MSSPPPPGYPGYPVYMKPPDHPEATLVLILGALGVGFCGFCAPFAWLKGRRVLAEIDASGGQVGGRSAANAGYIMGVIGSAVLGFTLLIGLLAVVFIVIGAAGASA
ncbi:DUF4190 domain-containing protein [Nocardia sp. NPDC058176]|uniref:DUF4190 domain-containing protein n=1 Tax=Nocardia sp. NPDC058176 TaxID=3346368 RepID=UPI0036D7C188